MSRASALAFAVPIVTVNAIVLSVDKFSAVVCVAPMLLRAVVATDWLLTVVVLPSSVSHDRMSLVALARNNVCRNPSLFRLLAEFTLIAPVW